MRPYICAGEMAERSNAAVLKTVDPKGPGVRIPLSPHKTPEICENFRISIKMGLSKKGQPFSVFEGGLFTFGLYK